jgi:NADH:ubiquinone oxidoreductase subunit 6 (subunit J)
MLFAVREQNFESPLSNIGRSAVAITLALAFILQLVLLLQVKPGRSDLNPNLKASTAITAGKQINDPAQVMSVNLFKDYLIAFELISLLLLVSVVGAVMIAKRNRRTLE